VTCTSHTLAQHVRDTYRATGTVIAMPSTVDKDTFRVRDKEECRRVLGLPGHARLIGTAGGLHVDKGVATLYEAYARLAAGDPTLHLVLAGPTDKRMPPPLGPRFHYLGCLPHGQVAMLFSALDVGVIYLRDAPFGRFCLPQKAYEMAACGIPIVAAGVGDTKRLFAEYRQCLYRPDDARDLAERIRHQLRAQQIPRLQIGDWRTIVSAFKRRLDPIVNGRRSLPMNSGNFSRVSCRDH